METNNLPQSISSLIKGIFLFLGLMLLIVGFNSCTELKATAPENEESEIAIPVLTAKIKSETIAIPIGISGTLSPQKETRLSFKVGGVVKRVLVEEGDRVKAGQLLATINLDEINAQVQQAQSGLEKAERDYKRATALYADSVGTLERLQNAKTALDMANAHLIMLKHNQQYSSIVAPDDGIVLKKFIEENELIGTGSPVFLYASTNNSWMIKVGLTDKDVIRIKEGDKAIVTLDAWDNKELEGKVTLIGDSPHSHTGLYTIELSVSTDDLEVKPGFFARAIIQPSSKHDYTMVPIEALHEGLGDKASIFLLDKDRVQKQQIIVKHIINEQLALVGGDDLINRQVVVECARELKSNQLVSLKSK